MAESASQASPTSGTAHSLPQTPQPPFSLPRRNTSLAFSQRPARTVKSPLSQRSSIAQTRIVEHSGCSQPNIGKKRTLTPACVHDGPSPGHVAQMQRIFQAAKATLHRDMFAASSPASSIESRMNIDQPSPPRIDDSKQQGAGEEQSGPNSKAWRYSTAPQNLAAVSLDVREPLPSPTLPDLSLQTVVPGSDAVEPISSGFSSPAMLHFESGTIDAVMAAGHPSNKAFDVANEASLNLHENSTADAVLHTELDQPLTELRVTSDSSETDTVEESPIISHLKRRFCSPSMDVGLPQSPDSNIYLSKTAEAAAESAKAKRRLLKDMFSSSRHKDSQSSYETDLNIPRLVQPDRVCPDPALHQMGSMTPCPDPSVHERSLSPSTLRRPASGYGVDIMVDDEGRPIPPHIIPLGLPRATATGSPLPFARAKMRPATSHGESHKQRMLPSQYTPAMSYQQYHQQVPINEHFQPGWYFAREPLRASARPTYSFSTAASKVIGSDQAPDSRIRDSYKTDTLTALARPPSRYRKTGIGAAVAPRGVSRYYQRPPSSMRPSSKIRPSSRQTYSGEGEVRFRSSPPRGRGSESFFSNRRKIAVDDSFIIEKDLVHNSPHYSPALRLNGSDEIMEVEEQTAAAVRLSICGTNTPEALHNARQGIKELSPNVQVFRKGTQQQFDMRKTRRPSYWDSDLKEVKDSPAGRGGVNSPVSAQASMQAEFEIASLGRSEMNLDDNDLSGEVARAGMQLEQRLSIMKNSSLEDGEQMDVDLVGRLN